MRALLLVALLAATTNADNTHFRNAKWGMSKAEVQATENSPLDGMKTRLLDRQWYVDWTFAEDQLIQASYAYMGSDYRDAFDAAKEALEVKYGKPECDGYDYCSWSTPETSIGIALVERQAGVPQGGTAINYKSTKHKHLFDKLEAQREKEKREALKKDTDKL